MRLEWQGSLLVLDKLSFNLANFRDKENREQLKLFPLTYLDGVFGESP